jgi:pyridoxine 4-dehydrogenase
VPYAESVGALEELQDEGKIRHVGVSNVSVDQLGEARSIVGVVSVQNRFNLADRGFTPAQVALAWLLARSPVMLPIPGTGALAHLEENVDAALLTLGHDELERLEHAA